MDDGKKWLYWFLFILVLVALGALFNILWIIGVGIFLIGLIIFGVGMENNQQEGAVWGSIIMVLGVVVFLSGISLSNYFEEIGVTGFLKNLFGKN